MDKRAYYIEYPERNMAVMLRFDYGEAEPTIRTSGDLSLGARETLIAALMTDGYETSAYTQEPEGETYRWEPIDIESLPEVTLMVDGPEGVSYGKRYQLRQGRVVEAAKQREKGKSQWHVDGADELPPHHVEPVAAPPYPRG